jgi:KaiC/GvpD/RAD55 family RecA-like ATPase
MVINFKLMALLLKCKLYLEMMLCDSETFVRCQSIFDSELFDRRLQDAAKFITTYVDEHSVLPTFEIVNAATQSDFRPHTELKEAHFDWLLTDFETFIRHKGLERAILKSADLLEKGEYGPVEELVKQAVQIGLTKDMGTDYFEDPRSRLMRIKDKNGQMSSGWQTMDKRLFGGMNKGELNIFAGGSGSGKSLVMMNIALSWLQAGLSGVYISLELSEELCALRTDAMLAGMSTKEIRKDIDQTELKVKLVSKKAGQYRIKALPAQSNINDIRSYIKEVQVQTGLKVDFVMCDYLDLLMPVSAKVSPNDLFVKDKYVSEELRNLAKELNVLFVTASQLNRSAVEEIEFDHSHISGGISKINTADNVFGIFTSRAMRERGKYQIQCMKSRSSTGVGMKIDLDYNVETMRITDPGEEAGPVNSFARGNLLDSIKAKSSLINGTEPASPIEREEAGRITADVQSAKLKQLLGQIKQS